MVCQLCAQLLEDYSKIADTIQLILRLFKHTLDQEQTIRTADRLTILRGHLLKTCQSLDELMLVLAVKCDICGYV